MMRKSQLEPAVPSGQEVPQSSPPKPGRQVQMAVPELSSQMPLLEQDPEAHAGLQVPSSSSSW
ncbi:MAG: hypothetical protein JRI23_31655 [Deltaproteobacteria bacterium]|nr:hypothetical protein [Deltaproteobacteria bacterium]MBW2536777.1 hypothetical protein [Deltaproteobacteria bacterium]